MATPDFMPGDPQLHVVGKPEEQPARKHAPQPPEADQDGTRNRRRCQAPDAGDRAADRGVRGSQAAGHDLQPAHAQAQVHQAQVTGGLSCRNWTEERRQVNAEFDWIVGTNVLAFRSRRDMTQKDLAHHAGMDNTVLNRVEIGQRSLKFREAICIAKALGVRVETLTRQHDDIDYTY